MPFQPRMTFINLAVKDLQQSVDFFTHIGFAFDRQFTTENAACMVINDRTFALLHTLEHFQKFTDKTIVDASGHVEVMVALMAESREQVDAVVNKALAAGGRPASEPKDYGFMYQASFMDLDGHIWEVCYMDPSVAQ